MALSEQEFKSLKQKVQTVEREYERNQGAITHLLGELKERFGCKNEQEAESLLKKLTKEKQELEEKLEEMVEEYKERWISNEN